MMQSQNDTPSKNRKLSAWGGSLLFHGTLLLIALFFFSVPSYHSAPGERGAVGVIVLQSEGGGRGYQVGQQQKSDLHGADSAAAELLETRFAPDVLVPPPVFSVLAPGRIAPLESTPPQESTEQNNQGQHQAPTPSGIAPSGNSTNNAANNDAGETIGGGGIGEGIGTGIGNQTGDAAVRFFGQEGKGTKFIYVFDRSGSMEGAPLREAKAELIRSLESLGEQHQFNIIFYSSSWQPWRGGRRLVSATEMEKKNAVDFIESIAAEGGTSHFAPLMEAIAHRPEVIFFLTDGDAQDGPTSAQLDNIARAGSQWGRRGIQINVIQFGDGSFTSRPAGALQQLAERNNGRYLFMQPGR